jgi:amidophosphoribosyltransferase
VQATSVPDSKLCTACFTGVYPIAIPTDLSEGKMRLEITEVSKPVESLNKTEQATEQISG